MSEGIRQRGRKNIFTGQVISDKMDKTISVLIYRSVKHPKYKKYIKKTSVFKVHDEKNQAKTGDMVRIFETRALSKTKRWKLIDRVQSSKEDSKNPGITLAGHENDKGNQKARNPSEQPVDRAKAHSSDKEMKKEEGNQKASNPSEQPVDRAKAHSSDEEMKKEEG